MKEHQNHYCYKFKSRQYLNYRSERTPVTHLKLETSTPDRVKARLHYQWAFVVLEHGNSEYPYIVMDVVISAVPTSDILFK